MQRLLLATTALAAISLPAFAQSEEAEVIIVTAQKREQAITEVPIAITAYGQEQLDELGVQQFDDLADFVPGLEVQEQSANNPGFVIRGITSDSGDATIEPRVSIYQDGVSIARSRGSFVEVFDTGAEVIRGPQPPLFGRSALIGAINLTSNRVDLDERAGSFRVGGGNLDFRFAEGMVNLPLNDMIGVRLAGRWKTRDGYIESLSAEDDFNGFETLALRASIRIQPTDALDAYIIINHHADNNPGTSFKSGTFLPSPTGSIDPWEPANLNSFGPFEGGKELGLERHVNSYTVLVDYDLNDVFTLSSVTNYREFDSSEIFDPDGFGYDLFVFAENAQGDQFSQEFRLGFEELNGFSGFVGASYFEEDGFQNVPLGYDERIAQALLGGFLFTDAPGTPQNPLPLAFIPNVNANPSSPLFGAPLGYFEESFTNFGKAQAWEFFADTTWQATDRLALTAGLRHTQDQKTSAYAADSRGLSNLTGVGIFLGTGVVTNGERVSRSDEFDGTTWRLAADFDLTDDVKLFANYASGRRPEVISYALSTGDTSVFATGQLNPANFNVLPAEEVDAYELAASSMVMPRSTPISTRTSRHPSSTTSVRSNRSMRATRLRSASRPH